MIQYEKTYTIKLPISVSNDISEWFEMMDASNSLSDELINIINNLFKKGDLLICKSNQKEEKNLKDDQPFTKNINQGDFFDNLYNWQDSNNNIFLQPDYTEEKVIKRKMLAV